MDISSYEKLTALQADGDHAKAMDDVNHYLENDPGNVWYRRFKIRLLSHMDAEHEELEEAIAICKTLIEDYPDSQSFKLLLAFLYYENHDHDECRLLYEEILEKDPGCYEALIEYAWKCVNQSTPEGLEQALSCYIHAAVVAAPGKTEVYDHLGVYFNAQNDRKRAGKYFDIERELVEGKCRWIVGAIKDRMRW